MWGDNPDYTVGAVINADIAAEQWKDWICRYYIAPTVPSIIIEELKSKGNIELIYMDKDESWNGMFWRFFAASDPDVDVVIFRDTDSSLHIRDKAAVDEWIASDKGIHIMRDMCQHGWHICGGLWGVKKGALPNLKHMIRDAEILKKKEFNKHGVDQIFLQHTVYPLVRDKALIHDEWFPNGFAGEEKHPMPIPRLRGEGWWKQEFPEWHCGFEFHKGDGHWFRDETCKNPECCLPCPACGEYHDNEFVGKQIYINQNDRDKYKKLAEILT